MSTLRKWNTMLAVAVLTVASLVTGPVWAAVEDAVPADAVLVVKVHDPAGQWDRLVESRLLEKMQDPSFMPEVAAGLDLARMNFQQFEAQTGVNLRKLAGDLLGREAALIGLPDDVGAIVIQGRSAGSLRRAVADFLEVERNMGNLRTESQSTHGGTTIRSVLQQNGKQRYHAVVGDMLVVSEDLPAVHQVVDVLSGHAQAIASSRDYAAAARMVPEDAAAMAYAPGATLQALSEMLNAFRPKGQGRALAAAVQARMAELMPLTRFAVLSVRADQGLHAQLTFAYEGQRMPAPLQAVLPHSGQRMDVTDLAPEGAALVGARQSDPEGAWQWVADALLRADPEGAEQLQRALDQLVSMIGGVRTRQKLFEELGEEVGVFVVPSMEAGGLPSAAVAIELDETAHIPIAAESIVGAVAVFASAEGPHSIHVTKSSYGGVDLNTVRSDAPGPWTKLSPTFGMVGDYWVAATSLELAQQIAAKQASGEAIAAGYAGTPFSVAHLSAPQIRRMIADHRAFLVQRAVKEEGKPARRAQAELEALDKILSLFEAAEFVATFRPGRTDHYVSLRLAEAAR